MSSGFPYQIVTFLTREPAQGEPVYGGENEWYPQLALKRRFTLNGMAEDDFVKELKDFFKEVSLGSITAGSLLKPERMPVRVIDIKNQDMLKEVHIKILRSFEGRITSRYPDREGDDYYPHITAEYKGVFVIPVEAFENKQFDMNNVWLLKDTADNNSIAYAKIV